MNSAESEFDPPNGSLRRAAGRGAVATAIAQAIQIFAQIASVILLSRLLSPGDFGLMAMVAPVIALLGMLQDFGLVQATVQKPQLRRDEVNFLFWINVAASVSLAFALIAISPLVAAFYQEPRATALTAAMALPMVIGALGAQHMALLNRRMEFGRMAIISVVAAVSTLVTAITWAMISPSYWALFGASLIGALVTTSMAWIFSRWRPGRPRRCSEARALLGFGAGITGFNFSNFFARNLDNVLIGRVWGETELGYYDRAYKLLLFPLSQIAGPLSRIMIPALSRMNEEPDRYRHAFSRVVKLSLLVSLPGVAFAVAMADTLIPFILGEQWTASAPIFMALGFAGMVQPLNNPTGWLFISQGRSTDFMIWGLVTACLAVAAFAAGLPWGAVGVATAYAISEYVKTPILWMYVARRGPVKAGDALRSFGPAILAAHVALAVIYFLHDGLDDNGALGLLVAVLLSYVVFCLIFMVFEQGRDTLKEAVALITATSANFLRKT